MSHPRIDSWMSLGDIIALMHPDVVKNRRHINLYKGMVVGYFAHLFEVRQDIFFSKAVKVFSKKIMGAPIDIRCVPEKWRDDFKKGGINLIDPNAKP
jgi:hypothetical protein